MLSPRRPEQLTVLVESPTGTRTRPLISTTLRLEAEQQFTLSILESTPATLSSEVVLPLELTTFLDLP